MVSSLYIIWFIMKKVKFFVVALIVLILSCHENDHSRKKRMYEQQWNDIIISTGRNHNYKATYFVKTNMRLISISPTQPLTMYGKSGDSIVKNSNSFIVDVYRDGEIQFSSRIFSSTVDTLVILGYKFKTFEELKIDHPYLIW